jgi:CubicO group peptidase (beta-lactamase class C family)
MNRLWFMKKILLPVLFSLLAFASCKIYVTRSIVYNVPGIHDNKILPVRIVKKGTPLPLCSSPNCLSATIPDSLMKILKQTGTVAFLVMKNDTILYEYYKHGYSDSSLTNPFSATKSLVSVLTGIALKEGKIKSLDEPVCNYYKPYQKEGLNKITFKDLLRMSSGVSFRDSYLNPAGATARLYYGNDLKNFINSFTLVKEPGTEFRYKNCDPEILTLALESAVGMNMSYYASEKLWKPLGAAHDAEWIIDNPKDGVEKTYCCFHTNARDLARMGMLWEHFGNWNGNQIVDSSYVRASITPHNLLQENGKRQTHNGYLWWIRNVDNLHDFSADGLLGQYVSVIPSQHLIFVRLGKKDWLKPGERFKSHKHPSLYDVLVRQVVKVWK